MNTPTASLAEEFGSVVTPQSAATAEPPGTELVNGELYMRDTRGALMPLEMVKTADRLQDEVVRKVMGYAEPLQAELARFREHTFDDVDNFVALLEQEHGAKRGGAKGNVTLTTYDGLMKVTVAVADIITFGPELQVAKSLIDECVREWSADGRVEVRALIERVFNVDKGGLVDKSALLQLTRIAIEDARWVKAMKAIRESFRPIGTKRYVQIHRRSRPDGKWNLVSLDMASA